MCMSPFWKNVSEELQYQGMNLKTLSFLTGVPYTTLVNGKNREDSIPNADIALKISKVLKCPIERLLYDKDHLPKPEDDLNDNSRKIQLFNKYEQIILQLEKCTTKQQDAVIRLFQTFLEQ